MRRVHVTIIVVFVAATLIFGIQNREMVTMDFLGFGLRAPLAIMAAFFYVLVRSGGNRVTIQSDK